MEMPLLAPLALLEVELRKFLVQRSFKMKVGRTLRLFFCSFSLLVTQLELRIEFEPQHTIE